MASKLAQLVKETKALTANLKEGAAKSDAERALEKKTGPWVPYRSDVVAKALVAKLGKKKARDAASELWHSYKNKNQSGLARFWHSVFLDAYRL